LIVNDLHDLNERLRKSSARWEPISIPFPSLEERAAFLNRLLSDGSLPVELAPDTDLISLARLTTGLGYVHLEDICLRAHFLGQPLSPALVKARKQEIMRSEFDEVLSILEPEFGFEAIGGMEEVKNDLRATVIAPMRSGNLRVVPQGCLLMGPAGTGKTRLARALAKEAGVTFVELQPAKIYSRWVGDTEARLERALAAISAWRPCIMFVDEIDQAMQRGEGDSGDSGVSARVFKKLMEFLSDTTLRGHVLFLASTNRPDLLDPALRRPGRLDKKIPILPPDAEERAAILAVLTQAAFPGEEQAWPDAETYQRLAAQMERYTGAELEGVVGKAAQLRAANASSIAQALQEAFERILPTTQQIEEMTRLALLSCNDLDLVPSEYRAWARELRQPKNAQLEEDQEEQAPRRRAGRRDW
jgi:SpoVK/Ycf46/Vps4 family AAA+-type ATPase